MKQRLGIAQALLNRPKLLICDEPTGNLDPKKSMEIMEVLEAINKLGTTVVMVTHNEEQARRTDRIVRFFDGRQVL